MNFYYVYAYLRADDSPYYIGKGKGKRAWSKNHGRVSVPNDKSRIVFLHENISESDAHALEIDLINQYGRKDLGTGILLNQTFGGEGSSGRITKQSTKEKFKEITVKSNSLGLFGFAMGHASDAGKRGGLSKSEKKLNALKENHKKNEEAIRGSKWMFNPISNTYHRIKMENVQSHINLGWQIKFRPAWNKGLVKNEGK